MEATKLYNVTITRKGVIAHIVLRDRPTTSKMKWGSGAMWTIVVVKEISF